MEPHPIPQNVTSFQFKLVGDMTLKQFMYLAIGSGVAYFMFLFLVPYYPIIGWPLVIISACLGVAFAFLGIASRPLTYWVGAFLKAVYSPTKRQWRKGSKSFRDEPLFASRLIMYLSGSPAHITHAVPPQAATPPPAPVAAVPAPTPVTSGPAPAPTTSTENLPTAEELKKTVELARQAQNLQMQIIQTERTLSQIKQQATQPSPIPIDYGQQVNKILADLQNLVGQASVIKKQMEPVGEAKIPNPPPIAPKVVIPTRPKQTQVALTTFPNVINGTVKDNQNNYLEGMIVVVYDKEGLPVRALKTNKLGQFTGSTPLPNGTYTLELEKEGYTFDVLQIELTGQVLPGLVISAK